VRDAQVDMTGMYRVRQTGRTKAVAFKGKCVYGDCNLFYGRKEFG